MFAVLLRPRALVLGWGLMVLGITGAASAAAQQPVPTPPTTAPAASQPGVVPGVKDGQPMSDADRDALAEYIRQQVEQRSRENQTSQPASRPVRPKPGQTPTTKPGAPVAASSNARLELSPTVFDFKEVWQGEPAEGEFTVKNVGTDPLTLETRSSCGCTVATKPESPLAPGATTTFKISYHTTRPGPANKTVTVTTNDPTQPSVVIKVTGTVKSPVKATPSERITFSNLTRDSVVSQTIKLEPNLDGPLTLKLRENQPLDNFVVELKEVEPGKLYELTATTKPPLRVNTNNATVILETGNEKVPTFSVYVSANVPPLVSVTPPRLTVTPTSKPDLPQVVRLQSRAGDTVKITDVKASVDTLKWEILPPEEPKSGSTARSQVVRVTMPAYDDLPSGSITLQIFTDAADENYRHFTIPIVKSAARTPNRAPAGNPLQPTTSPTRTPPPTTSPTP